MSKLYRYALLLVLGSATLACGILAPISDAKNFASTAEAIGTTNPLQTLEALPSSVPDVTQYLNPVGQPVSQWNDFPIMPKATAGQEFNKNTYSFKINAVVDDVEKFYKDSLEPQGWSQPFSAQSGTEGGLMFFTKDSKLVTITITPGENGEVVVVLFTQ